MRTISRISAAFQLVEGCGKGAVTGASILVDGRRVRHAAKGDGTYVFADLPPTAHRYEISAPGFCPVCRELPAAPEHLPEVVVLQYQPGAPALSRLAHFRLRFLDGGAPISRGTVRVTQMTPVGALRLVEKAGKGSWSLALAGNYTPAMAFQSYQPQGGGDDLLVTGCDRGSGQLLLQEPLAETLGEGTLLRPVWELETDRDGTAILPAIGLFLQREEVALSFSWDGREQTLVTAPPSPSLRATVEF